MKEFNSIIARITLGFDYTESINEAIRDGDIIENEEDVKEFIKEWLIEDLQMSIDDGIDSGDIVLETS